jgi:hypothetical protein
MNYQSSFRCLLLLVGVALVGCGGGSSSAVRVTGKVTHEGKPLEVKAMVGKVNVVFEPMDASVNGGSKEYAVYKPDGSFEVPGKDGRGLPPGKYRICIMQYDSFPGPDSLKDKFGEGKSPLIREVNASNRHFEIDVATAK